MRSRYTAYTKGERDYLLRTWHSSTRPAELELEDGVKWLGLKVVEAQGGAQDSAGMVRFVARFKVGGRAQRMEEKSRFVREDGRWVYLDGEVS
jgi:SEC-C motif-containing protein